jgi:hypothetical protein
MGCLSDWAVDSWDKKFMSDAEFAFYAVALIDLLGQSRNLEKFGALPLTDEERKNFIEKSKKTFGRVRGFRKIVLGLRDELTKEIKLPDDFLEKLKPEESVLVNKHLKTAVDIEFMGDSAMLKVCLKEKDNYFPLMSIWALLDHLSTAVLDQLSRKIPMRGAIDVGICTDLAPNSLYGQAVSRAHQLESQCADYPRILIGENFLSYLRYVEDVRTKEVSEQEKKIIKGNLTLIKKRLSKDTDGHIILNYLGDKDSFSSLEEGQKSFQECIQETSTFIQSEINLHKDLKDHKIAKRYERLKYCRRA